MNEKFFNVNAPKTARKCLIARKAKARYIQLIECLHDEKCEHKMSFGKGYFCNQIGISLCERAPEKTSKIGSY